MKNVLPRKEVPRLRVETTRGMQWDIRDQKPENFTMVIFYRGLHCPVCKSYLEELNRKVEKFQEKGVSVICISANNKTLAEKTVKEWK
ncbi:redoxin domain-containing protein [Salegentibacter sp. UBA1130]|uniref:redoxin domain-containing protein n=1 Tax=Salegentibacter sp. UBA1130 TaxID=1947451 RepID=UPI0032E4EC4F